MLDFGWAELFVIIALAIIVIGPKDIQPIMVGLGRIFRRISYIRYAISQQFDEIMRDADLNDIRKSVNFEVREDENFDETESDESYFTNKGEAKKDD
ncbi:MAG: hypothetical protein GC137_08750 [Alphaproteobacteria bacterium]|nr:hypothetical protein [Alphaproteobacteria bacterium]